ncbi:hypothetical protein GCM10023175_05330 [Pseudonocardia xishanensis]|uniref:Tyr recombinase domain-containing protein n=1 Tax=Pseudonocardia xishanensis TaxID=630995 RepID=A0ABP8RF33_9PSEU
MSLREASGEWLRAAELEESIRRAYCGLLDRTLPTFGDMPLRDLSPRILEQFYADLRRCRLRCTPRRGRRDHVCQPFAASTVRQMRWVISGTVQSAVRWGRLDTNLARGTRIPRPKVPEPDPPTPREAAILLDRAFVLDDDWGTLIWLVMTTGIRRGELRGLRFGRLHLDEEIVDIRRSRVGGREKDTKAHHASGHGASVATPQGLRSPGRLRRPRSRRTLEGGHLHPLPGHPRRGVPRGPNPSPLPRPHAGHRPAHRGRDRDRSGQRAPTA